MGSCPNPPQVFDWPRHLIPSVPKIVHPGFAPQSVSQAARPIDLRSSNPSWIGGAGRNRRSAELGSRQRSPFMRGKEIRRNS